MKSVLFKLLSGWTFLSLTQISFAINPLQNQLDTLIRKYNAKIGVAIRFDNQETITVNDHIQYAMLSTFKFPLALAVLNTLDKNGLPLNTEIYVTASDLLHDTYSPLRDVRPEGNFKIGINELLKYSVSLSDNNACDILIKYLGGHGLQGEGETLTLS